LNEITVPTVHFIESASRHHVWFGQIQEALFSQLRYICRQLPDLDGFERGGGNFAFQSRAYCRGTFATRHEHRPASVRPRMELGIDCRLWQILIRASERRPGLLDIR